MDKKSRHRYDKKTSSDYHERKKHRSHKYSDPEPKVDKIDFSYSNYKNELNSIIYPNNDNDKLIHDLDDFWKFVIKYESLLKKSGKPILENNKDKHSFASSSSSSEYDKFQCINFKLNVDINELLSKIYVPREEHERHKYLTRNILEQFLKIVLLYIDFKNREKFTTLKKLRKFQSELPVAEYRHQIVETVRNKQIVIIAGDTGCGKSTQVPQYLSQAGFKSIACTQPRRIACISLAKRVAYESLSQYGTEVGYQIRFEKNRNQGTKICFITEGLLLRQIATESNISKYDVIILDEIHERHLHGDFLLGIMKCLIQSKQNLRIVLMSATINIKLFHDYFASENAVVIEVPGRLHPIDVFYRPVISDNFSSKSERIDPQPYVQIMQIIDQKYSKNEKGDLLIFLSGMQEITSIVDAANQYAEKTRNWIILPLHSSLSISDQDKVFDYPPDGVRKCIVSTNIAETSVTIDGIRFVVDSGKVKEMNYDPSCKMQRLKEFWIPKSSAEQRKGRAGRTGPGVCFRIYSEKEYAAMDPYGTPELLRVPLDSLLLLMISLGLKNVRNFPFLDAPQAENIENALQELKQHFAVTSDERLTPLGKALSQLPVDIVLGKMLILGSVLQQSEAVMSLAAALSVQTPYTNKAYRDIDCQTARQDLESDHGDPLSLLNIYTGWLEIKQESSLYSRNYDKDIKKINSKEWCKKRGFEEQRFYEITKLRTQFQELLQSCSLLDILEPETMTSTERALRHGQLKYLKEMRRKHKNESVYESRKRKKLKMHMWEVEEVDGTDANTEAMDIRDVEFHLKNDMKKVHELISGNSASNHRDLSVLKLIVCRALYPQIAVADEYNHYKSVSEQLFHTSNKAFVSLHPMSYYGNHPQILQLEEGDIEKIESYHKSKLILSSNHQVLCYLSLLETTKPYLMNSMRMPAAQTLLLFAHCIDTDLSFSRFVCDSWLQLEFPVHETGLTLLLRASKLRKQWDDLINNRLKVVDLNTEGTSQKEESKMRKPNYQLQHELSEGLAAFMSTKIIYSIKRLLPADLKSLFNTKDDDYMYPDVNPNPFDENYKYTQEDSKGGIYLTDNIIFGSLHETEWSQNMYDEIIQTAWKCEQCEAVMCLSPIEKLQHKLFTCSKIIKKNPEMDITVSPVQCKESNLKKFECDKCNRKLFLTPVEILKHKKHCST